MDVHKLSVEQLEELRERHFIDIQNNGGDRDIQVP